jgi:hypothetical protein
MLTTRSNFVAQSRRVLADTIEDDDGVVHRVADDRQMAAIVVTENSR